MMKGIKYVAIGFATLCALIALAAVGNGFVTGLKKQQSTSQTPGTPSGMPRETWLARFRPIEIEGQCVDSPLQRSLKVDLQSCVRTVEPLFQLCTSGQEFSIPSTIESRQEAERLGSLVGECITAHHFGGEHLETFRRRAKG